jgi:hypothetical protein
VESFCHVCFIDDHEGVICDEVLHRVRKHMVGNRCDEQSGVKLDSHFFSTQLSNLYFFIIVPFTIVTSRLVTDVVNISRDLLKTQRNNGSRILHRCAHEFADTYSGIARWHESLMMCSVSRRVVRTVRPCAKTESRVTIFARDSRWRSSKKPQDMTGD